MEAVLTCSSLVKEFKDIRAVKGISFKVNRGEVFGFLGPNGAGKTTAIKIMCGLLEADEGSVKYIENTSIGLCPQEIVIWENLTILEQLVYIGKMHSLKSHQCKNRSLELIDALGLMNKKDSFGNNLSGGMQRRLNIALALMHRPDILFLDEPQAGLDPQSRVLVRDYIQSIKKETTVILTTHDMEEAEKLSDRICIIDQGEILAMGTTDEIKQSQGYEDIIEIEIEGSIEKNLVPYIKEYQWTPVSEHIVHVTTVNPDETFKEIFSAVKNAGVTLKKFSYRKKSLEDIFISLTGRGLRE